MKVIRLVLTCALWTSFAFGQFTTRNPLDQLKDQVAKVLADAGVPFTSEQERQLALLIEEERQASEDLFGVIMDFRAASPFFGKSTSARSPREIEVGMRFQF